MRISFTTSLSHDRGDVNPIHPVTYLQLSYSFGEGGMEIFSPEFIMPRDVDVRRHNDDEDSGSSVGDVYSFAVAREDIPRVCVPRDDSGAATVTLHAWKQHKLLASRAVGVVEGLGFHGEEQRLGRKLRMCTRSLRESEGGLSST